MVCFHNIRVQCEDAVYKRGLAFESCPPMRSLHCVEQRCECGEEHSKNQVVSAFLFHALRALGVYLTPWISFILCPVAAHPDGTYRAHSRKRPNVRRARGTNNEDAQ